MADYSTKVTITVQPTTLTINGGKGLSVPVGESKTASIVVKDGAGKAIKGANVTVTVDNGYLAALGMDGSTKVTTDKNGKANVSIVGIEPGACTLSATVEGTLLAQSIELTTVLDSGQVARPTATVGSYYFGPGAASDQAITVAPGTTVEFACHARRLAPPVGLCASFSRESRVPRPRSLAFHGRQRWFRLCPKVVNVEKPSSSPERVGASRIIDKLR